MTNDVHSSLWTEPGLVHAIDRYRERGFLIADSGDFFEGTLAHEILGSKFDATILQELYDVIAPGNHGFAVYEKLARSTKGPVVTVANLIGWPGPPEWIDTQRGLLIVGILGEQSFTSCSDDTSGYRWTDPIPCLEGAWKRAQATGLELVVLSHQGFAEDRRLATRLAESGVKPIAIFSGHCHSEEFLDRVDGIAIVKGVENGRGYAILSDGEVGSERIADSDRAAPPHPLLTDGVRLLSSELGAPELRLRLTRDIASDRGAMLEQLTRSLLERCSSGAACLNRGAVRRSIDDDFPLCSRALAAEAVPFDNPLCEVLLRGDAADAMLVLANIFGEDCVLVGEIAASRIVTTSFLAARLERENLVVESVPTGLRLRDLAVESFFHPNEDRGGSA